MNLYTAMCECLQQLPDDVIDQVTHGDLVPEHFNKAMFTRCYLVSNGNQPLSWLNPVIEIGLYNENWLVIFQILDFICNFNFLNQIDHIMTCHQMSPY